MKKIQRYYMVYDGFDECVCPQACDSGSWVNSEDAEVLEVRNKELEAENTALRQRVAYLESCICETCHDPECKDSALNYYVGEYRGYKKENEELQARIDAYLKAQEPKECAAPVCGTLCKACEENI